MFDHILAFGYLPGILGLGSILLSRIQAGSDDDTPTVCQLALAMTLGLAALFPLLAASAWMGIYSPSWFGALGWVAGVAGSPGLARRLKSFDRRSAWLLVLAIALFSWYGAFATENVFAGRDQGLYSNHAVHIARTGSLFAEPFFRRLFEGNNYVLASSIQAGGYAFDIEGKYLYFQFPPTTALHFAQAFGIAGYSSLFLFNPMLASLNALLAFALVRRFLDIRWATLATLFFALNLAQVWNSRTTLSEILAQNLILAGLALCGHALERQHRRAFAAGAALLAGSAFVRIDAFLAPLAFNGACLLLALQPTDKASPGLRSLARAGAVSASIVSIAAIAFGEASCPVYYADFTVKVSAMIGGNLLFALATFIPLPNTARICFRRLATAKWFFWALAIAVGTLSLYAYFVRPYIEPFSHYPDGFIVSGRDFRENGLRDLGAYLSMPATLLAVVGLCLAFRRALIQPKSALLPFIAVWLVYTLLYCYNPLISPDHIWKIRRFVPIVLPGFAVLSVFGFVELTRQIRPRFVRIAIQGAATYGLLLFIIVTVRPIAFLKQNAGATEFIETIAQEIPSDALLVATVPTPILGPLQLAEGLHAIRASEGNKAQEERVRAIVKEEASTGREVYLLSTGRPPLDMAQDAKSFHLTYSRLKPTTTPPPTEIQELSYDLYLMRLDAGSVGFKRGARAITVGAQPVWGVEESGFYGQEFANSRPFRWTHAHAELTVPWIFPNRPVDANLQVFGAGPGGSEVTVRANGIQVFNGKVPREGGEFPLDLATLPDALDALALEIDCDTWTPAEVNAESKDTRELGLQLAGIVIKLKRDDEFEDVRFGPRPVAGIAESGLHGPETVAGSPARWTDGHATFELRFASDYTPTRLRIEIVSMDPRGSSVEARWNGRSVLQAEIASVPTTLEIDLPADAEQTGPATLELVSSSFVPADRDANSPDKRALGIMIGVIHISGESDQ